jgi:hypothetical protein
MKIQRVFTCTCGRKIRVSLSLCAGSGSQATCPKCRNVWKVDDDFVVSLIGVRGIVRRTWFGATDAGTEGKACHETVEQLDNPGHPWLSFCRTHGRVTAHEKWESARYNAEHTSEWCECCYPQGCGDSSCESCVTAVKSAVGGSE